MAERSSEEGAPAMGSPAGRADRILGWLDRRQRASRWWSVVVGVVRKRSDDRGGWLGALIGHYLFVSALPLLVVLTWILGHLTATDPDLRRRVTDTVVGRVPVLGDQLRHGSQLDGSGVGLLVALALTLVAGMAVLVVAQQASDTSWGVPRLRHQGLKTRLRSLAVIAGLAVAAVLWAAGAGVTSALQAVPLAGRALAIAVGVAFLALLATALLAVLTPHQTPHWWEHWPGGVAAAIGWSALSQGASAFIAHQVVHWGAVYGTFALVIALLAWMALIGQVTVTAIELNVVLRRRLFPRRMAGTPTDADLRAAELIGASRMGSVSG
jgi:uncharacterized BrkB/YihY/UPF0761 family membrane protein